MNKKHLYFGIGGAVLCLVGVLVAFLACNRVPKNARLLDENAIVVVKIDPKQMMKKSGLAGDSKAKDELQKLIKKYAKDEAKFINELIDDPGKTGFDFSDPMFFSFSGGDSEQDVRFVGSVKDDKDLTKFLEKLNEKSGGDVEIEESDGYHCLLDYSYEGGYSALVYNDDYFMYRGYRKWGSGKESKMDAEDIIDDVKDIFEGKNDNKLLDDDAFKKMCKRDGVAQLLVRGKGLADIKGLEKQLGEALPDGCELADISYLLDTEINDGEVVVTGEFLLGSDEWEKAFKESEEYFGEINAEYADYISKDKAMLVVNLNGEKIVDKVGDTDAKKEMGSRYWKIFSEIFETINGDIAFVLNDISDNSDIPTISAYAHTQNNKLISFIANALEEDGAPVESNGKNSYTVDLPKNGTLLFGYDNKASYFVMGQNSPKAFGKVKKPFEKGDIKGRGIYAFFNFAVLSKLDKIIDETAEDEAPLIKVAFKYLDKLFDYAEFYFENNQKFVLRLVSENKDQTPIEVMIENLNKFITDIMDAEEEAYKIRQRYRDRVESDYYSYEYTDSVSEYSYDAAEKVEEAAQDVAEAAAEEASDMVYEAAK